MKPGSGQVVGEKFELPPEPEDTGMSEDHRMAFESQMWEQLEESVQLGWMSDDEAAECFAEYREKFALPRHRHWNRNLRKP